MNKYKGFHSERKYCRKCKEKTFWTTDERVLICQGCMSKIPRTRQVRVKQNWKTANPESLPESNRLDRPYCPPSAKDKYEDVRERFHKLSDREREVIELLWEEKTQQEISEILNISQQRVAECLKVARNKLK